MNYQESDLLPVVRSGRAFCPICARARINSCMERIDGTSGRVIHMHCRRCKTEYTVDIKGGQCYKAGSL